MSRLACMGLPSGASMRRCKPITISELVRFAPAEIAVRTLVHLDVSPAVATAAFHPYQASESSSSDAANDEKKRCRSLAGDEVRCGEIAFVERDDGPRTAILWGSLWALFCSDHPTGVSLLRTLKISREKVWPWAGVTDPLPDCSGYCRRLHYRRRHRASWSLRNRSARPRRHPTRLDVLPSLWRIHH